MGDMTTVVCASFSIIRSTKSCQEVPSSLVNGQSLCQSTMCRLSCSGLPRITTQCRLPRSFFIPTLATNMRTTQLGHSGLVELKILIWESSLRVNRPMNSGRSQVPQKTQSASPRCRFVTEETVQPPVPTSAAAVGTLARAETPSATAVIINL